MPVEVPEPGLGQLAVLVEASAVSVGTERARWLGLPGAKVGYPHHPGYSLAGVVRAVGPGVHDVEPGARVAVWGAPHQSLVTVDRTQVHVLAPATRFAEASLVTLGAIAELGVARGAAPDPVAPDHRADGPTPAAGADDPEGSGRLAGQSVAVIGAGAIGLLAQRIASAEGAAACTVVAASTAKDAVVRGDPSARLCPPAGVDDLDAAVVIEATGAADGIELALRAAASGGTVVLLGTTRAEAVSFALDLVHLKDLRVVGAHAGLLDVLGGIDGLDRRGAAQRFLDRAESGALRVDDLLTSRVDPGSAAAFYDRLASDRRQVVPVLEWWRLAPEARARPGGLPLPNPFRRDLAGEGPASLGDAVRRGGGEPDAETPVVEHPPAPVRPAAVLPIDTHDALGPERLPSNQERPSARASTDGGAAAGDRVPGADALTPAGRGTGAPAGVTVTDLAALVEEGRRVRVAGGGGGELGEQVRKVVVDGGAPAAQGPVDVVVDLDPTAESVAASLADLGPAGVLVVGGQVAPIELDVQTLIHRRGTTVRGLGWHDG